LINSSGSSGSVAGSSTRTRSSRNTGKDQCKRDQNYEDSNDYLKSKKSNSDVLKKICIEKKYPKVIEIVYLLI
jgi:hypothetical protein